MREVGNTLFDRDDITDRVGEITCPAIVFHGTEDQSIEMELAENLNEGLPGSVGLVRIEGAAHAVQPHPRRRGQRAAAGVSALVVVPRAELEFDRLPRGDRQRRPELIVVAVGTVEPAALAADDQAAGLKRPRVELQPPRLPGGRQVHRHRLAGRRHVGDRVRRPVQADRQRQRVPRPHELAVARDGQLAGGLGGRRIGAQRRRAARSGTGAGRRGTRARVGVGGCELGQVAVLVQARSRGATRAAPRIGSGPPAGAGRASTAPGACRSASP